MSVGQQSHALFYSIFDGHICRTFKEPTKDSKPRVNKKGNTVHEEYYAFIDGIITDIQTREHQEYGKFWLITLKDGEDNQVLQLNYSSGYSSGFLKMLPNVDLSKSVKVIPSVKSVDGKPRTSIFITQEGKALKHFWTKDSPGDLPPLVKTKFQGKDRWDDYDQMKFLEAFVKENILPKLGKTVNAPAASAPGAVSDPAAGNGPDFDDDLPF